MTKELIDEILKNIGLESIDDAEPDDHDGLNKHSIAD